MNMANKALDKSGHSRRGQRSLYKIVLMSQFLRADELFKSCTKLQEQALYSKSKREKKKGEELTTGSNLHNCITKHPNIEP